MYLTSTLKVKLFKKKIYKINFFLIIQDSKDVEVLWRLARALYNISKTASDVEAKKLIYDAFNLITEAAAVDDKHWAVHKWTAILIDSKTNYEGMKEKIKTLNVVKEHMLVIFILIIN